MTSIKLLNQIRKLLLLEKAEKSEMESAHEEAFDGDIGKYTPEALTDRSYSLTQREYDVFLLLLEGYTLKECALKLGIKYSTANTHMTSVYRKLSVSSRAELIIRYYNSGCIPLNPQADPDNTEK